MCRPDNVAIWAAQQTEQRQGVVILQDSSIIVHKRAIGLDVDFKGIGATRVIDIVSDSLMLKRKKNNVNSNKVKNSNVMIRP